MAPRQPVATPAPFSPHPFPTKAESLDKAHEDKWTSSPPQITSYLTYSRIEPSNDQSRHRFTSGTCGLGWHFQLDETFDYLTSASNHRVQELVGQASLRLLPHLCSSMPLSPFKAIVKISYPGNDGKSIANYEREFSGLSIQSESELGTYVEPVQYVGPTQLEITLIFDPTKGLALPTTPSIKTHQALHHSLDGPTFVDTKFYLFSARVEGRPAIPKPIYAKSLLLSDTSNYIRDLLSSDSSFAGGTPCDLRLDVPEEIAKLDTDLYDYVDDSDLEESEGPSISVAGAAPENASESAREDETSYNDHAQEASPSSQLTDGRAFAINGTAHKTWKAFMFYTYTNSIRFNNLRSQRLQGFTSYTHSDKNDSEYITCSPKSMYRFADYVRILFTETLPELSQNSLIYRQADLPDLKSLAKEGISKRLSRFNIVEELFSVFTSKYQEIIELEVDYLVRNFTGSVRSDFDEILQMVVLGTQAHCFRVLAFTIKRLLGDDVHSAWAAIDGTEEPVKGKKKKQRRAKTLSESDKVVGEGNSPGQLGGKVESEEEAMEAGREKDVPKEAECRSPIPSSPVPKWPGLAFSSGPESFGGFGMPSASTHSGSIFGHALPERQLSTSANADSEAPMISAEGAFSAGDFFGSKKSKKKYQKH